MDNLTRYNQLVYVHNLPDWLQPHLNNPDSEYFLWATDYQRLLSDRTLWRIWLIDEYGDYWLEVNYIDQQGAAQFNTLKLEPGTYALVDCDEYLVLREQPGPTEGRG